MSMTMVEQLLRWTWESSRDKDRTSFQVSGRKENTLESMGRRLNDHRTESRVVETASKQEPKKPILKSYPNTGTNPKNEEENRRSIKPLYLRGIKEQERRKARKKQHPDASPHGRLEESQKAKTHTYIHT